MAENLTPKKYIDDSNMKQILTAVKNEIAVGAVGDKYFSNAPIGVIQAFSGQTIPHGYLLANGASYPTADYPDLYAVIGNTYGGDTENFNVPTVQPPALTMVYIIKAFHTNEGVDSGISDVVINYINNSTKVDVVLYNEFDIKVDNIQNSLYLLGNILYGSLYLRFNEEHNPFAQGFDWVDIADVPQIISTRAFYNCISYSEILDDNDYAKGDVRIWKGKLQIRIRKQPTVSRLNWYIFCNSICEKVELAK